MSISDQPQTINWKYWLLTALFLIIILLIIYCCCCPCNTEEPPECIDPEKRTCVQKCICDEFEYHDCCNSGSSQNIVDNTYIEGPYGTYQANRFLIYAKDSLQYFREKQRLVNEINSMLAKNSNLKPKKTFLKNKVKEREESIQKNETIKDNIDSVNKDPVNLERVMAHVTLEDLEEVRTCAYNNALHELRFVIDLEIYLEVVKGQSGGGMRNDFNFDMEYDMSIQTNDLNLSMQSNNRPSARRPSVPRKINKGDTIKIAILDSGIESSFVSDHLSFFLPGYNVIEGNTNTNDQNGHGTAIADVMIEKIVSSFGASLDTLLVKIIPVKILNRCGLGNLFDAACGLYFAAHEDATIVNMSVSTCEFDLGFAQAFYDVVTRDSLTVVSAAGNDSLNIMEKMSYPFAFQHFMPNVMGVTGLNMQLPTNASCDTQGSNFSIWKGYGVIGDTTPPAAAETLNRANMTALNFNLAEACIGYDFMNRLGIYNPGNFLFGDVSCDSSRCYSGTSFAAPLISAALAKEGVSLTPADIITISEWQNRVYQKAISPGHYMSFPGGIYEYTLGSYWYSGVLPPP